MHQNKLFVLLIAVACGVLMPWANGVALTLAELTIHIAAAERQPDDDVAKPEVLRELAQAKAYLEAELTHQQDAERFRSLQTRAPTTLKAVLAERAKLGRVNDVDVLTATERALDTAGLEHVLEIARGDHAVLESKLNKLDVKLRELVARSAEIPAEKSKLASRIAELDAQRGSGDERNDTPLSHARTLLREAELAAQRAALEALNQEISSQSLRNDLALARRDLTALQLTQASARVSALEQHLVEQRQIETSGAQQSALATEREVLDAHPLLQRLARENTEWSAELGRVVEGQARAIQARAEYAEQRQQINDEYERARQRLQIAGTSAGLGRVLVDQRRRLPQAAGLQRQAKLNLEQLSQINLRRLELDEQSRIVGEAVNDLPAYLGRTAPDITSDSNRARQVSTLLLRQRELLASVDRGYASYLRVLDAADSELQQLTTSSAAYRTLLDERLLWIPNAPPLGYEMLAESGTAIRQILAPMRWRTVLADLRAGVQSNWLRFLAALVGLGLLLKLRSRLIQVLSRLRLQADVPQCDRVWTTIFALLVTSLLALPLPMALWIVGEGLKGSYAAGELSLALGQTLRLMALLAFVGMWWGTALRDDGIVIGHFDVNLTAAARLRRGWMRFIQGFIPLYSVALAFEWLGSVPVEYGLRRAAFLAAMAGAATFGYWLARKGGLLWVVPTGQELTPWAVRIRFLIALLLLLSPLALMALSATGYHYTAVELSRYCLLTWLVCNGTYVFHALTQRWLRITAARFAATQVESAVAEPQSPVGSGILATFNVQADLVLRNAIGWSVAFGLYFVWRDVFPALTIFDQISLWDIHTQDLKGQPQIQSITIANVAVSIVIAAVTLLASRNVPGVIEIGILQRFRLHHGSRYAITSLCQYVIIAVGVSLALRTLGLRWSQVQWLVAALGVGLGFGLQEIFANFISGLILLFERPIRVGDVVTIGEMTGTVNRIQIRATTIRDADNKEIVVPNKTFITERFVNWTLSDQVTRVVVTLGIAYGADVEQAIRLLLEIAHAHPKVMRTPAPQAALTGFGDSALLIELQVYAEELQHRTDVRHELNAEIYRAFATHGIELAYPQRDLHLRSLPASVERVLDATLRFKPSAIGD